MELGKVLEIIWRRKLVIIQGFLVIFLTTVIGSFLATPVYEASAKVLVSTTGTASSLLKRIGLSDISSVLGSAENELETYIALAGVNPVVETVIRKLQIRDRSGSLLQPGALCTKSILYPIFPGPYVEINEVEDADLLEIKASSPDPEEVSMIANTLAETFVEHNLMRTRKEHRNARAFIEERIVLEKANYLNALNALRDFKVKEKTVHLQKETEIGIEKIAALMKEKEDNIIDISEVKAKIRTLKSQFKSQEGLLFSSSAISTSPQIKNLAKTLSDLQRVLAGALIEKRPEHPEIKALRKKIWRTKEDLKAQMAIFQKSSFRLEVLESDLAALEAHLKGVNADIQKYLSMMETIPQKAFDLAQLRLKLNINQELYSSLLEYLYKIGVAEAMTLSDITLVEPAITPKLDKPKSPNIIVNGAMGMLLGLVFGFGLAFLIDHLDDTIKTPDEFKLHEITLLGSVPMFRRKEQLLISERDPKGYVSEAYRTIRNSIKFASLDKPANTLVVTSSMENEGKTTTVVNLAISYSREPNKVLIVDTDLRKPKVHEVMGLPDNAIGLSTVLAGEISPKEAIRKSSVEGLNVLSSGPVPPDPGSVVESSRMEQVIEQLSQHYDIVLLDTPPMLAANDSLVLAAYADTTLLVLESERITHRALSQSLDAFRRASIFPSGAILNKYRVKKGGYYYHYKLR